MRLRRSSDQLLPSTAKRCDDDRPSDRDPRIMTRCSDRPERPWHRSDRQRYSPRVSPWPHKNDGNARRRDPV